jgi:UDP-2,3-diacylglucosamine hydrolase
MLFISDLHLSPSRPHITSLFLSFLEQRARGVGTLFILGDLFDCWVGDDDPTPPRSEVMNGLRQLVDAGTEVNLLQGNRDFLMAEAFAGECGAHLLNDCTVIDCNGEPTLLMHGDLLCTDDHTYQRFRALSRSPEWQSNVLSKPLWVRLGLARWYRIRSYFHKRQQTTEIMDVNTQAVWRYAEDYGVSQLIHGHTHRPGYNAMMVGAQTIHRYVLGDWGKTARILSLNSSGLAFETISLNASGALDCQLI